MEICLKNALELNPRYLKSGFKTQARNISANQSEKMRQLACLMQVISEHILQHGNACFAFTGRLLSMYNKASTSYNTKPISERTLTNRFKAAEQLGLISRNYHHNHETGQTRRLVSIVLDGVQSVFPGVFNYAAGYAMKHHTRHTLPIGRSDLDDSPESSAHKGSQQPESKPDCRLERSKISLEREENKYNGTPSDSFYVKHFKQDANDAKTLQQSARKGLITASGAKKLIAIHAKHGFELAKSFKRYLNSVIAKAHSETKRIAKLEQRVFGGSANEAMQQANQQALELSADNIEKGIEIPIYDNNGRLHLRHYHETMPTDQNVTEGRAEYYRDTANRVQIRWIHHELWEA
jgi:hypothetical protein